MILRRVIEHVKTQNWVAVFLDFVIVVVGILIAFQINAWSARQAEKQSLHVALERLRDEIQLNIGVIDENSKLHDDIAAAGHELLDAIRDPELDEIPMVLIGTVFAEGFTSDYSTGALTYVLNQQPFHNTENGDLRRIITTLPAQYLDALEDERVTIQLLDRQWVPYISQYLPVETFWNLVNEKRDRAGSFQSEDGATIQDVVSLDEFKQLASTLRFQNEIVNRIGYQDLIVIEQRELRKVLGQALALIEEELE
ncbi:DUF6090 family protein [Hyphococcus flavus]|uniref:DUF6090 family protein n=1 Tax=Hyphococcus flavus TaxID=1866326 RepID=A0AAE9ZC77_9PROT|nr:DUF6090 family protein [Hyphococcus flavus]WDI32183.1 DUF6090 family protein [Hyphococcus flavus]